MTDTNSQTYLIAEDQLSTIQAKLDKLARKAERLGTTTIIYALGEFKDLPYARTNDGLKRLKSEAAIADAKAADALVYFRFREVTVTGTTPRLAGWSFVATLQHLADDKGQAINLLRTVPSFKGSLPVHFRTATPENCDHCHRVIRTRKDTFVVRHEDGTWKQVGRTCTQDFLGGKDPHAVAAGLDLLLRIFSDMGEAEEGFGGFGGGGSAIRYGMDRFLAVVAMMIRLDGWTSRGKAREADGMLTATADSALEYLTPPRGPQALAQWERWVSSRPVTDEDREVAQKALDFAQEVLAAKTERSDYEHNLYVATVQSTVDHRLSGITASLVPYYLKEVERRVIREAELRRVRDSKYLGTVDEKLIVDVQVAKVLPFEGFHGTKYLHKLITPEGDSLVWWNSGSSDSNLKLGETYTIKGTVKKHEEYEGVKQTTLLRVKTMTAEEVAKEQKAAARKVAKAAKAAPQV